MADTVLELAVPARLPAISALRRAVEGFLADSVERTRRYQILLVVSELATNAIEAVHNPRAEVLLRAKDLDDNGIVIEIEDDGPGFGEAMGHPGATMDDERGRGLQVVRALVDDFSVDRHHGRTTIRCAFAK